MSLDDKKISITITDPQVKRLIRQYSQELSLEPAQVVALAMKQKLPKLGNGQ